MIAHISSKRYLVIFSTIILIAWVVLLSSCGSNKKVLSAWADPEMSGKKIEDILVIVAARDDTVRKIFENSFERSYKQVGVKVINGHTVDAVKETISYDTVVEAAQAANAKMVLITRLIDVRQNSQTRDSLGRAYVNLADAEYGPGMYYAGSGMSTSTSIKTRVNIECQLYDVATKKLISDTRYQMVNPVMTNKYLDGVTQLHVAEMEKQNLL